MESFSELITSFKKYLSTSGRGVSTVNSYTSDLKRFASFLKDNKLEYHKLELAHLEDFTNRLKTEKNEGTNSIRRKIISLRQFYKFLSGMNVVEESPFTSSLIPERKETLPALLDDRALKRIFEQAQKHSNPLKSSRDLALISLLSLEGIKVSELIELSWFDFLHGKEVSSLQVRGLKKRTIDLDKKSSLSLKKYYDQLCKEENKEIYPHKNRPIFIGFKGRELETCLNKITRHGMKFLLYDIGLNTGIKKLNTELLRHHAIAHLLERFGNTEAVQGHLGLKRPGNILKHLAKQRQTTLRKN